MTYKQQEIYGAIKNDTARAYAAPSEITCEQRIPEISVAIENLSRAISCVEDLSGGIISKLSPILSSSRPQEPPKLQGNFGSQLACSIQDQTIRLEKLREYLEDLAQRIEL
jgi:hypothetical protein